MSLWCRYCQRLFTRADSRSRHQKYRCQMRFEVPPKKIIPTETSNGNPTGIETGEAFRFKTPSSILVVGPSGCGKSCFTESLLLDHSDELFREPPETIHYCYGAWQDGFVDMKRHGIHFHEGVPTTSQLQKWFPNGGLLVLDDLMAEGTQDKELLDLFTKHSHHQNITVMFCVKTCFQQVNTPRLFPGTLTTSYPSRILATK